MYSLLKIKSKEYLKTVVLKCFNNDAVIILKVLNLTFYDYNFMHIGAASTRIKEQRPL
jgi:hypothetical protein